MPARHIDIAALKASFRAAATARGIDPLEGSTGYQVANLLAEQRRADPDPNWWKDHELWSMEEDDIHHSPIEDRAIMRLFFATYLKYIAALGDAMRHPADDAIPPLRDRLAAQGIKLEWIDQGDGSMMGIECPLKAAPPAPRRTHYKQDRHEEARALRATGMSILEISIEMDINQATISRWLRNSVPA